MSALDLDQVRRFQSPYSGRLDLSPTALYLVGLYVATRELENSFGLESAAPPHLAPYLIAPGFHRDLDRARAQVLSWVSYLRGWRTDFWWDRELRERAARLAGPAPLPPPPRPMPRLPFPSPPSRPVEPFQSPESGHLFVTQLGLFGGAR